MGKPGQLTYKQKKFTRALVNGKDIHHSLIDAGLTTTSNDSYGYQLLHKEQIIRELSKHGMDDNYIARQFKQTIDNGVKNSEDTATADTALRGIELYYRITGRLNNTKLDNNNTSNNIYINELKILDNNSLRDRLTSIASTVIEQ